MRVLIDESLPRQLAAEMLVHEVATVQSEGWSSMRNGELLRRASAAGFSVFVTADQGIEFQQNLGKLGIGVIVVRAKSNRMEHLRPLVPELLRAIQSVVTGDVLRVGA